MHIASTQVAEVTNEGTRDARKCSFYEAQAKARTSALSVTLPHDVLVLMDADRYSRYGPQTTSMTDAHIAESRLHISQIVVYCVSILDVSTNPARG